MKLLASAPSKDGLIKLINKYFYSENYTIKDDMPYNLKTGKLLAGYKAFEKRGRWRFELHLN